MGGTQTRFDKSVAEGVLLPNEDRDRSKVGDAFVVCFEGTQGLFVDIAGQSTPDKFYGTLYLFHPNRSISYALFVGAAIPPSIADCDIGRAMRWGDDDAGRR